MMKTIICLRSITASTVNYDPLNHNNDIKEFVGIQNYAGIKKLVFEDVELNGPIIVLQDFIFESKPLHRNYHHRHQARKWPQQHQPQEQGQDPVAILSTSDFNAPGHGGSGLPHLWTHGG